MVRRHLRNFDRTGSAGRHPPGWRPLGALLLGACAGLVGCSDNTGPTGGRPPYIAIVTKFDAASGVDIGTTYTYHVRELSGTVGVDTFVTAAPTDTVIVPVLPATYTVSLDGVPAKCVSQYGLSQDLIVPEGSNTTIARYFVICRPLIRLMTATEGVNRDNEYVYRVSGGGVERVGLLQATDTTLVEELPAGTYDIELFNVAGNCAAISPGGAHPRAVLGDSGGVDVSFRIACSDETKRPRLLSLESTHQAGINGVVFTAIDPDGDMAEYIWDVTDCRGNSVVPNGHRSMRGLQAQRTAFQDTITVVAAFETGVLDQELDGRCTGVRVLDDIGNTTGFIEVPIRRTASPSLAVTGFEAEFEADLTTLLVDVAVAVPGSLTGIFATLRLRDGSLGQADGNQDIGIYNTVGYLDTTLPPVSVGTRFQYFDVLAVELYLFDSKANFALLRDDRLF